MERTSTHKMNNSRMPVIFDTDLGEDIDDLYALCLAILHPKLDIKAVTTVHGDTQMKARLARKVLRLAARPDIPVGAGIGMSQARVARGQVEPDPDWGKNSFIRYVVEDDEEWGATFPSAAQVISDAIKASLEPVAFVVEGAFSNVAQALIDLGASAPEMIRAVAAMGGETHLAMSEYNVWCDPEAAEIVLNCGLPAFLGTYELTSRLVMTMAQVEEHFGSSNNPLHRVIRECTALWEPCRGGRPGPVLYDLVPVFWLANNNCVQTRQSEIHVEIDGKYTRGQTMRRPDSSNGRVLELTDLDSEQMMHEFLRILCSL
jgi:purine nucleosidase